ncbi:MFS transporter [Planotetraspora sp. GP83]|uniref:MFS transporter n=1 Tax=Planotetraspora sp. GP83 TaxID=3156264 RepID=UPI003517CADC
MRTQTASPDKARSLVRLPGLRPLLAAEVTSTTGSQLTMLALPWLVLTTTGSPAKMGWVMAAELVPVALLGAVGGTWASRFGPRRWMILSDLSRGLLIAAVPLLHLGGMLTLPVLLGLVFAIGLFTAPYLASQQTIIADLLGEDEVILGRATSLLQGAVRTALLIGPPVAAGLIALLGAPAVLFINALTYLATALLIWCLVPAGPSAVPHSRAGRVADGWKILRRDRLLTSWTLGTVLTEAAWQALFVAIPVLAVTRYGGDVGVVGIVMGAFGAGAVGGSLLALWALKRYSAIALTNVGKVAQGLLFGLLLLHLSPWGLTACLLAAGLFNGLTNGPAAAVRLKRITPPLRPQTLTLISAITVVGGSSGLILGGVALDTLGEQPTMAGMVAAQSAGFILFLLGSRRSLRATW